MAMKMMTVHDKNDNNGNHIPEQTLFEDWQPVGHIGSNCPALPDNCHNDQSDHNFDLKSRIVFFFF